VSLDLPVVFCNSFVLEGDPGRFAHGHPTCRFLA
jgi:hypothetical protein